MPSLADIVGQYKQDVNTQTQATKTQVTQGVQGAVANAVNDTRNAFRGALSNVAQQGINSVVGAASSVFRGDLDSAVASITGAPGDLASAFMRGLSGKGLFGPGAVIGSEYSGSGSIVPGDALSGASARPDPLLSYCWYAQMPVIAPPATQSILGSALGGVAGSVLGDLGDSFGLGGVGNAMGQSLGNAAGSALGGSVAALGGSAAQLPWYYVEGISTPFRNFTDVSIFREGRDRKYAGKYNVDDLRVSLYLDSGNNALNYLQAWQNQILKPFAYDDAAAKGGGFGRPVNYKKSIKVVILSVTMQQLCILDYRECWPSNLSSLELKSGASDRLIGEVTFHVGDVFVSVLPLSSSVVSGILGSKDFPASIQSAVGNLTNQAINFGVDISKQGAAAAFDSISSYF